MFVQAYETIVRDDNAFVAQKTLYSVNARDLLNRHVQFRDCNPESVVFNPRFKIEDSCYLGIPRALYTTTFNDP